MDSHGHLFRSDVYGVVRGISDLLSGKTVADQSGSQQLAADGASAAAFEIPYGLAPPPKRGSKPRKKPSKQSKRKAAPSKKAFETSVAKPPDIAIVEAQELPVFPETPTTFSKAAYFRKGEVLARVGVPDVDEVLFSYFTPPDAYLRIIPVTPFDAPLKIVDLQEAASRAPMLKKLADTLRSRSRGRATAAGPLRPRLAARARRACDWSLRGTRSAGVT